jgi:DNA-binding LacI/PurR family transcriptional regulator
MSRRPTIADVAEASGFSRTMVSHALSGKRELNADTARKIRAAAAELGYSPSRSARSLRLGRTGMIGLLSPAVGDRPKDDELLGLTFYMRLTAEVARHAFDRGQMVLLMPHTRDLSRLSRADLDGALFSDPERNDPLLAHLREAEVPVVTLEQDPDHPDDPWQVSADHAMSTLAVLDHFRSQGAAVPALLIPDIPWAWVIQVRSAYEAWCEEHAVAPRIELVREGGAEQAATRLLTSAERPDAVFALAEGFGPAVLAAAARLQLGIPDDFLLACGVDSPQAMAAEVPITAVVQAPERQARAAVDLLLERIAGEPGRGPAVVPPELVIRRSSLR